MDKTVLVVEDEPDLAVSYERLLRRHGCRVSSVGSRQAALQAIAVAPPPELVIADLRLPDGDGLDIVRAARALPQPPPVLVVTVFASRASRRAALEAGAAAVLAKPFDAETFIRVVNDVMRAGSC